MLTIHEEIYSKLNNFIEYKQVPHIIFHGPYGSGKKTIVQKFLKKIYNNELINDEKYIMYVDCAIGKGIKFVREDIKFFAKTNVNIHGIPFKSIVFFNADKLTTDAQSALRRCIELFSHSTRFFIIIEDKYKLLKPICSRFCDIYVGLPKIKNEIINLHEFKINELSSENNKKKYKEINATFVKLKKDFEFQKENAKKDDNEKKNDYLEISDNLYFKGISGIDIISYLEKSKLFNDEFKFSTILFLNKIKKEFRNEKTFIFFILTIIFLRKNQCLENIAFM